jgi:hypothetical protein
VLCNHRESLIVEIEPSTCESLPQILQLVAFTYVNRLLCYVENINQLLNCLNASGCRFCCAMLRTSVSYSTISMVQAVDFAVLC